jgi:hypothetical protein
VEERFYELRLREILGRLPKSFKRFKYHSFGQKVANISDVRDAPGNDAL